MAELTHEEIYKEFCEWNPELACKATEYKPWGSTSIMVRFKGNNACNYAYKIKRYAEGAFVMQMVSEDDINRKYGLNQ